MCTHTPILAQHSRDQSQRLSDIVMNGHREDCGNRGSV